MPGGAWQHFSRKGIFKKILRVIRKIHESLGPIESEIAKNVLEPFAKLRIFHVKFYKKIEDCRTEGGDFALSSEYFGSCCLPAILGY